MAECYTTRRLSPSLLSSRHEPDDREDVARAAGSSSPSAHVGRQQWVREQDDQQPTLVTRPARVDDGGSRVDGAGTPAQPRQQVDHREHRPQVTADGQGEARRQPREAGESPARRPPGSLSRSGASCVRACERSCVCACVRGYMRPCARAFVRTCVRAYVRASVRSFIRSFEHLSLRLSTSPLLHFFVSSFLHISFSTSLCLDVSTSRRISFSPTFLLTTNSSFILFVSASHRPSLSPSLCPSPLSLRPSVSLPLRLFVTPTPCVVISLPDPIFRSRSSSSITLPDAVLSFPSLDLP